MILNQLMLGSTPACVTMISLAIFIGINFVLTSYCLTRVYTVEKFLKQKSIKQLESSGYREAAQLPVFTDEHGRAVLKIAKHLEPKIKKKKFCIECKYGTNVQFSYGKCLAKNESIVYQNKNFDCDLWTKNYWWRVWD